MFGIFGKFNFLVFCFLISQNWENNHASSIPQLHAAVGPLEQVGYPPSKVPQQGKKIIKFKKKKKNLPLFPVIHGGYQEGTHWVS